MVNQAGDVLACRNSTAKHDGTANPPAPQAAFVAGEQNIDGMIAANAVGTDGETWVVVH